MPVDLDVKNELQWVKEGRVFQAKHADLTTPQNSELDLVETTPDLVIRVPQGVVIVPLRVSVEFEATGGDVDQCQILSCDIDPTIANKTEFVPTCLNPRYGTRGSKCTAGYLSTGAIATPVRQAYLHHVYVQVDVDAVNENPTFEQIVYAPLHGRGVPAIVGSNGNGTGLLVCTATGTSGTCYITGTWAEWFYDEFYL